MKLNLHLHYDLAITFLSIYPREIKTYFFQTKLYDNFYGSFINNSPTLGKYSSGKE